MAAMDRAVRRLAVRTAERNRHVRPLQGEACKVETVASVDNVFLVVVVSVDSALLLHPDEQAQHLSAALLPVHGVSLGRIPVLLQKKT